MERRTFIKNTSLTGLALSTPFSGNVLGKNEQINLAIIGVGSKTKIGGKGKQDLRAFMKIPGVNICCYLRLRCRHSQGGRTKIKKRKYQC